MEEFEAALCEYTGAPFCVATDSCTNALHLAFMHRKLHPPWSIPYRFGRTIEIVKIDLVARLPKLTYVGVARAAMNAGYRMEWIDLVWHGEYEIPGFDIIDAARWLRRGMHRRGKLTCLSFHATKHLPIGRGGAILCDNVEDAEWFRRARYDGRDQTKPIVEQTEFQWGIHCYMPPESAARGLLLMSALKDDNEPLPGIYQDLSKMSFT